MPIVPFRSYIYTQTEITALAVDPTGLGYLWEGFTKNSDDVCILAKVGGHDPFQVYYEIELDVDAINRMVYESSYIYLAVDDDQYIGYRYLSTNPLSVSTAFAIPAGVNEAPVDVITDGTDLYFLTPGNVSGEVAKVIKMSVSGTLDEVITLEDSVEEIHNAVSIAIDTNSNLWIVTSEDPSKLVRVYQASGGAYVFDVNNFTI